MTYITISFNSHHTIFKVNGINSLTKEPTEEAQGGEMTCSRSQVKVNK